MYCTQKAVIYIKFLLLISFAIDVILFFSEVFIVSKFSYALKKGRLDAIIKNPKISLFLTKSVIATLYTSTHTEEIIQFLKGICHTSEFNTF